MFLLNVGHCCCDSFDNLHFQQALGEKKDGLAKIIYRIVLCLTPLILFLVCEIPCNAKLSELEFGTVILNLFIYALLELILLAIPGDICSKQLLNHVFSHG